MPRMSHARYGGVHDPTATSEAFGSILVFHLCRSTVITYVTFGNNCNVVYGLLTVGGF